MADKQLQTKTAMNTKARCTQSCCIPLRQRSLLLESQVQVAFQESGLVSILFGCMLAATPTNSTNWKSRVLGADIGRHQQKVKVKAG